MSFIPGIQVSNSLVGMKWVLCVNEEQYTPGSATHIHHGGIGQRPPGVRVCLFGCKVGVQFLTYISKNPEIHDPILNFQNEIFPECENEVYNSKVNKIWNNEILKY